MRTRNAKTTGFLAVLPLVAALGGFAEDALVRLNLEDGGTRTERVALAEVAPAHVRFAYPKERIAEDVVSIDVVPDFMTARTGDEGYWVDARGAYGRFEMDDGEYSTTRAWTPVFAMKRGGSLWYGHVTGWRYDFRFHAAAKGGRYEAFPRFMV